jgi:hypothetical protein
LALLVFFHPLSLSLFFKAFQFFAGACSAREGEGKMAKDVHGEGGAAERV